MLLRVVAQKAAYACSAVGRREPDMKVIANNVQMVLVFSFALIQGIVQTKNVVA